LAAAICQWDMDSFCAFPQPAGTRGGALSSKVGGSNRTSMWLCPRTDFDKGGTTSLKRRSRDRDSGGHTARSRIENRLDSADRTPVLNDEHFGHLHFSSLIFVSQSLPRSNALAALALQGWLLELAGTIAGAVSAAVDHTELTRLTTPLARGSESTRWRISSRILSSSLISGSTGRSGKQQARRGDETDIRDDRRDERRTHRNHIEHDWQSLNVDFDSTCERSIDAVDMQ